MNDGTRRRALLVLGGAVLLAFLGAWVYFTFLESPEAKIRRVLGQVAQAARERNPGDIGELLAADFRVEGRRGGADKAEVHRILVRLFLVEFKHGFDVTFQPEEIPVEVAEDGESALASYTVLARGKATPEGDWIPLRYREAKGDVTFVTRMRRTAEGWRLERLSFQMPGSAR